MASAIFFTSFLLLWAVWWGRLHSRIRKNRGYAQGREAMATDEPYRWLNPLLFVMQVGVCAASFWLASPWLIEMHHSDAIRIVGAALFCGGSALYTWALAHLGPNYSPCYDICTPTCLVRSGPYRKIRHPMYAGKIIVATGTVVVSGSLWFVPTTIYLLTATLRAMFREERRLEESLPEYRAYKHETTMLVPWCC